MFTNGSHHNTAYAEYINTNLPLLVEEGQGLYTYKELAVMVGLKPTQHFRRRVRELVQRRVLDMTAVFTPRGGIENRFSYDHANSNGDLPF